MDCFSLSYIIRTFVTIRFGLPTSLPKEKKKGSSVLGAVSRMKAVRWLCGIIMLSLSRGARSHRSALHTWCGAALIARICWLPVWLLLIRQRLFPRGLQLQSFTCQCETSCHRDMPQGQNHIICPPVWSLSGFVCKYRLLQVAGRLSFSVLLVFEMKGSRGHWVERCSGIYRWEDKILLLRHVWSAGCFYPSRLDCVSENWVIYWVHMFKPVC